MFSRCLFVLDVFVDYEKGKDNSTCGQTSSPCKTLSKAVDRTSNQGTIKIRGDQYLNDGITLNKSLTIQGIDDSSIFSLNNQISTYAFEIFGTPDVRINISFIL